MRQSLIIKTQGMWWELTSKLKDNQVLGTKIKRSVLVDYVASERVHIFRICLKWSSDIVQSFGYG